MNKPGWKMSSVFALIMCTSLVIGGQAHAATKSHHHHQRHQNHQTLEKQNNNDESSDTESSDEGESKANFGTESDVGNDTWWFDWGQFNAIADTGSFDLAPSNATPAKSAPFANASDLGAKVIKAGEKYMGTPYQYGASRSSKRTMDCSSFTMWAFREGAGIDLGRGGARSQYKKVKPISRNELQVGDLMFFSTRATMKYSANSINRIGHVGIYAGNNKILHTFGKGGVTYSNFSGWWDSHFVAAGRVLN